MPAVGRHVLLPEESIYTKPGSRPCFVNTFFSEMTEFEGVAFLRQQGVWGKRAGGKQAGGKRA